MRPLRTWTGMMTLALACCAAQARAQSTSYRLTALPERPTSRDSIRLILDGVAESCLGPTAMFATVHEHQVDIELASPALPFPECPGGAGGPWSLETTMPPLAAGFYAVHLTSGGASQTIRVVDVDEPEGLRLLGPFLGRFGVSVTWGTAENPAHGYTISDVSGRFWFFDAANTEVSIKLLDGRAVNGHFWVFLGSMTNVPFEVTVTDFESVRCQFAVGCPKRIYTNPAGRNASVIDLKAF